MKSVFFFLGSSVQWPIRKPREFLLLHAYIACIRFFVSNSDKIEILNTRSILTFGVLIPLCYAINQGIPLDCLDYKAAIERENIFRNKTALSD